ncbi:hypothetical protein [Streptomyces sp. NBC_01244]|uniref:hypothetical protein n=1 Tax=Streptomyces sp. NBC_01244 TaxID=2903797 RepID=UPI002E128FC6|nr:hypothetical protein OG247_20525 [Streptomyces sp. NBC_01244]
MTDSPWDSALPPIEPFYAFNGVGEPITLHRGEIHGVQDTGIPGEVSLRCSPVLGVDWSTTPVPDARPRTQDTAALRLQRPHGQAEVEAWARSYDEGWINGAALGESDAPLTRLVAHWFNLPRFKGHQDLTDRIDGADRFWSGGRWSHEVDGWKIHLDVRPDHKEIWDELLKTRLYAMTHTMQISRTDGRQFTAAEARHLLVALHFGMSFCLGRWVAPLLPVGIGADGGVVWEEWAALHCDPAKSLSSGWWQPWDPEALARFMDGLVPAFSDPVKAEPLRLQISYAITAIRDQGFVEQRVMIGAAGLEHAMWQRLVLAGVLTRREYKNTRVWKAHIKLRKVLEGINVSLDIDKTQLPAMARFIDEALQRSGEQLDGPEAVTRIRNSLVHPEEAQKNIYEIPDLVTEAWLLTRHYLSLLVLESLGYRGPHQNLARIRGWAGETEETPWS